MPHLPWTDQMLCTLLNIVLVKGAHVCNRNKTSEIWSEVLSDFFLQDEMQLYRATHYIPGDYRKIKDKFLSTLKVVKADIDKGNQSGKDGELSPLYVLVKHVLNDIDTTEEEKAKDKATKVEMEQLENSLLIRMRGKRSPDNDAEHDCSKKSQNTMKSWESHLMALAENRAKPIGLAESEAEQRILDYINKEEKTEKHLANQLDEGTLKSLNEISLRVIVSLYCAKGENFTQRYFKESMKELGIPPLVCHKIYTTLEDWRKFSEESNYSTPNDKANESSSSSRSLNVTNSS